MRDDGPGIDDAKEASTAGGIGRASTRARLDEFYGGKFAACYMSGTGGNKVLVFPQLG